MADIALAHAADGGDILVEGGRIRLDLGPLTAAYLSLFGGNLRDAGRQDTARFQWWGNLADEDRSRHLRSETQHLLRSLPAISANLNRLRNAVHRDLAWMSPELSARIEAHVSLPARGRVAIEIRIELDGQTHRLRLDEPWEPPPT